MRDYRIYLLGQDGRIHLARDFKGKDDLSALAEGEKHSGENAVEIWEGSRLVARVNVGNME